MGLGCKGLVGWGLWEVGLEVAEVAKGFCRVLEGGGKVLIFGGVFGQVLIFLCLRIGCKWVSGIGLWVAWGQVREVLMCFCFRLAG